MRAKAVLAILRLVDGARGQGVLRTRRGKAFD